MHSSLIQWVELPGYVLRVINNVFRTIRSSLLRMQHAVRKEIYFAAEKLRRGTNSLHSPVRPLCACVRRYSSAARRQTRAPQLSPPGPRHTRTII